ncbi:MAG: sulfatase [Flavobacterium sp.]|uniref:sulfatase n=1 Tax=Flavobacterium sp. TaxID=239 RepID=UPI003BCD758B
MKNQYFKLAYLLFLFAITTSVFAQNKSTNKPNILFIAVDDLKPVLGCYGNTLVKTTNIDRLAKMATVFNKNYCQQAICGPTRASLMTGTRPDATKIWNLTTQMRDVNPNTVTLPQYLITQGYTTSGIGKIYHPSSAIGGVDPVSWSIPYLKSKESDFPAEFGIPANGQYQLPETKDRMTPEIIAERKKQSKDMAANDENPKSIKGPSTECIDVPDTAYQDGVNALLAKNQIIALSKSDKPFFMAVGFSKPHLPFVAPKKYWDLYKREDMPIASFQEHSKNGPLIAYHQSGELRNYLDIPEFATLPADSLRIGLQLEKQRELIHGYYAAISYMDAQVGILLNTLESLGTLDNTIIVLWGDHGWHLGDHDLWHKHTNFEEATRAPLIIAGPGINAGKTSSLTEFVDVFPTICDLAGVAVPKNLDGKSLKPLMLNNKTKGKEYAISQYPRKLKKAEMAKLGYTDSKMMGYSLRTDQYRYTIWMNNFTSNDTFNESQVYASEMYDYVKDPLEKVNVVKDKNYTSISATLKSKMIAFFKSQETKQ